MKKPKRQNLPEEGKASGPDLTLVATPIGNLGDWSPRARQVFDEVDTVLCEDTRSTMALLSATKMTSRPKLERADAHEERRSGRLSEWVRRAESGERFAYVSDAGTPGISDPGSGVVQAFREAGLRVESIPGPAAVSVLVSLAGVEGAFAFHGFPSREKKGLTELCSRLEALSAQGVSHHVFYESPERIAATLKTLSEGLPGASGFSAKELTKLHEKHFFGSLTDVAEQVAAEIEREGARGEWSFLVSPLQKPQEGESDDSRSQWNKAAECLVEAGVATKEAARLIAEKYGVSRNETYAFLLGVKKSE